MAKTTKGQQAAIHLDDAAALFTDAHDKLGLAEQLAREAEQEDRALADEHLASAETHANTADRAARIRTNIAAIIS